ncbi:MAG: TolB family protein, partial [Candidatus Binatia bacterium]
FGGALSADGRVAAFWSDLAEPVGGTGDGRGGVFVHDRASGTTQMVSVSSDGTPANFLSSLSGLSRDGRLVAFDTPATNLVAGDTNGNFDLFLHDRATGFTSRINVSSDGEQAGEPALSPLLSNARFAVDGRRVYFLNPAHNLALADPDGSFDLVRDRLTGQTARIPYAWPTAPGESAPQLIRVSTDGLTRVYELCLPFAGQPHCRLGVRVDTTDPSRADLTGDGDAGDTLLSVLDAATGSVTPICPAAAVSIAGGAAAFLRPEPAGTTPALSACPTGAGGGADLNGDGDADDQVVHLWSGGAARNLARAATAVSLSEQALAALVAERDEGARDLNGDGDALDDVVQVFAADRWRNLAQAADAVQAGGGVVAFTTPEAGQGNADLNADGDAADRVVQVFEVQGAALANVGQAAEDLVVGASGLVAFRTREASQGNQVLNGDGDGDDDVLQVYDPVTGTVLNTGLAVTPCRLEACDPRAPYRVLSDTVKFLTFESAQGADLNGDGDRNDLVVQVVNVRQACHTGSMAGACHALAAVTAGICTNTAQACAGDATCGGGTCFVPPGGCIRDLHTPCTLEAPDPCNAGEFCQPALGTPGVGTCQRREGACRENADCAAPATCSDGGQTFNRLLDPLKQQNGGAAVFTGAGHCVEDFGTACQDRAACGAGAFCEAGTCRREQGTCARAADCPTGSVCRQDLVQVTADDRDADELPDAFDNCPETPNIMQEDGDGDGVGDACEGAPIATPVATPPRSSEDDGCMVVRPRPVGVVALLGWLLPALVACVVRGLCPRTQKTNNGLRRLNGFDGVGLRNPLNPRNPLLPSAFLGKAWCGLAPPSAGAAPSAPVAPGPAQA